MDHTTLLNIINNVKTYPELMIANTAFLEYVLTTKVSKYNLDQLYREYNNKKTILKSDTNIYDDSVKLR
jgi:hypothetical protein